MSRRYATLGLFVAISALLSSIALAHIGFKGDFECRASYATDCYLFSAEIDRRTMQIFFDGTVQENGKLCELRTIKLQDELAQALAGIGAAPSDVTVKHVSYTYLGSSGHANEYRCSYDVTSRRHDLRFKSHQFSRRYWISAEDRTGVCLDDVRQAQAIPGAIGAAKWLTATLAQGQMCETHYATIGFDRTSIDANGTSRLIKFGSEQN